MTLLETISSIVISGIVIVGFFLFLLVFFAVIVPAIQGGVQRMFYLKSEAMGNPYTFEELQYLCNAGIYDNLTEYEYFYSYNGFFGDRTLSKKDYNIVSLRLSTNCILYSKISECKNEKWYCLTEVK